MSAVGDIIAKARATLLKRGVSIDDADDLVHDAFVRLEHHRRREDVRSPEALLVRSAVNLSIDAGRRRRRAPFASTDFDLRDIVDDAPDTEQILEAREQLRRVSDGIARLPEQTRRIFLARRVDGLEYADIAAQENLSLRAVQERVARATLSLMKWMKQ